MSEVLVGSWLVPTDHLTCVFWDQVRVELVIFDRLEPVQSKKNGGDRELHEVLFYPRYRTGSVPRTHHNFSLFVR